MDLKFLEVCTEKMFLENIIYNDLIIATLFRIKSTESADLKIDLSRI